MAASSLFRFIVVLCCTGFTLAIPCTTVPPNYVLLRTINPSDDKNTIRLSVACAPGKIGFVSPRDYFCDGSTGTLTPALDGCGDCGIFRQAGYRLDIPFQSLDMIQYSYNIGDTADPGDYACDGGTETGPLKRGYALNTSAIAVSSGPTCRLDPGATRARWVGFFEGCVPVCPQTTAPGGVFRGHRLEQTSLNDWTSGLGRTTEYLEFQGGIVNVLESTFTCAAGWAKGTDPSTNFELKCSFYERFEWSASAGSLMGPQLHWCSYPTADWDADRGEPKRGKRWCEPFVPTDGLEFNNQIAIDSNFDVAHGYIFGASEFSCTVVGYDVTSVVRGSAECVNGKWVSSLTGCKSAQCPAWREQAARNSGLIPRGYSSPPTLSEGMTTTGFHLVTACEDPMADAVPLTSVGGGIVCSGGSWRVHTPFVGCRAAKCLAVYFKEQYEGYILTPQGGGDIRDGELLNESSAALPGAGLLLACDTAENWVVDPVNAMTSLGEITCERGRFVVRGGDRSMRGCARDPTTWCDLSLITAGTLEGYRPVYNDIGFLGWTCADGFVVDTVAGTVTGPLCSNYNNPPGFGSPTGGWDTTSFAGCMRGTCNGDLLSCKGACRRPAGKFCVDAGPHALCCYNADDPRRVTLGVPTSGPAVTTNLDAFGHKLVRMNTSHFFVLRGSKAKLNGVTGGLGEPRIYAYVVNPHTAVMEPNTVAFYRAMGPSTADEAVGITDFTATTYLSLASRTVYAQLHDAAVYRKRVIAPLLVRTDASLQPTLAFYVFRPEAPAFGGGDAELVELELPNMYNLVNAQATFCGVRVAGDDRLLVFTCFKEDGVTNGNSFKPMWFVEVRMAADQTWSVGVIRETTNVAYTQLDAPTGLGAEDTITGNLHVTPIAVRAPYVFAGASLAQDSGSKPGNVFWLDFSTAPSGSGPWERLSPRAPFIRDPAGYLDNEQFGTSIAVDRDLLVVGAPLHPSCTKGVVSAPARRGRRLPLYDVDGVQEFARCAQAGAVFVFRYSSQTKSWGTLEAIFHPPAEVRRMYVADGAPADGSFTRLGHRVAVSAEDSGTIFATSWMTGPRGVGVASAVGADAVTTTNIAATLQRSVLVYKRRRVIAAGRATEWVWYHSHSIGTEDWEGTGARGVLGQWDDGGYGNVLLTLDGQQVLVTDEKKAMKATAAVPTDAILYSGIFELDATADSRTGVVHMYEPLLVHEQVCGPIPRSLLSGVVPGGVDVTGAKGFMAKCGHGQPAGTVCDGEESGFHCDTDEGYCGIPTGYLVCGDDGVWRGELMCSKCVCESAPSIDAGAVRDLTFFSNCTYVEYGGSCEVGCASNKCGQPATNLGNPVSFIHCNKVVVDANAPGGKVGAWSEVGLKTGTCARCTTGTCAFSDIDSSVSVGQHTYSRGWAILNDVVTLECDAGANMCLTGGLAKTVTCTGGVWTVGAEAGSCAACPGCAANDVEIDTVLFDGTTKGAGNYLPSLALASVVPIGQSMDFNCSDKMCVMDGYEAQGASGRAVCEDGGGGVPRWARWAKVGSTGGSLTAAGMGRGTPPTHCRPCWGCREATLVEMYPQFVWTYNSVVMADGNTPHYTHEAVATDAVAGACRPPYTGTFTAGVDFRCIDGFWEPAVPATALPSGCI